MKENNSARITVIMGIYNCESTIADALDSLLSQTYKKIIILMCDDNSTDGTYDIAHKYTTKYPNIILLKNVKNQGLNYTLNRCLDLVETEYIARMDGDDISLPERFQKQLDFLDSNPQYSIVSCPMIYFNENGNFRFGKVQVKEPTKYDFVKGTPFCHAPSMMRTSAIKSVGGYSINKRLLRVEDYHLWFKMYSKGFRGYNSQGVAGAYDRYASGSSQGGLPKFRCRLSAEVYSQWLPRCIHS